MASPTRPVKYPRQLVIMLDDATADRIEADAVARGVGKSVVARELISTAYAAELIAAPAHLFDEAER